MPPQESQYVFIDVYQPGHKRSDLCEIQIHSKVNEVEQLEQLRSWWGDPRACVWEHLCRPGLWQLQCHCHHWDCSSAWLPRLAESPGQGEHHTASPTKWKGCTGCPNILYFTIRLLPLTPLITHRQAPAKPSPLLSIHQHREEAELMEECQHKATLAKLFLKSRTTFYIDILNSQHTYQHRASEWNKR